MAKKKFLDQDRVTTYARLKTYENRLSRWTKTEAEELKELMIQGYECPTLGPSVLVLTPAEGRISWKEQFQQYLTDKVFKGNEAKAAGVLAEIEASADRGEGSFRLNKKLNDSFATAKAQEEQWENEIVTGRKSA
jgi:hypothetical protein